jgi:hypothetical protein
MESKIDASAKDASKSVQSIGDSLKGAAIGSGIALMIGQIVSARSEFERFGAVLKTTLGSEALATSALDQISEFAARTPFEISELTDAFVKLTNRGLQPSIKDMEALGDLASSTGKDFNMLAEAVLDATTGEFERLKEFGIRASKDGDKVTFAFKGVQTQVEFTEEAINSYILSLGNLEGVSGSMAAISETLGGKVSNLKDSWNQLLVALGDSPAYKTAISGLTSIFDSAKDLVSEFSNLSKARASFTDDEIRALGGTTAALKTLNAARAQLVKTEEKQISTTAKASGAGKAQRGPDGSMVDIPFKELPSVLGQASAAMQIFTGDVVTGKTATEQLTDAGTLFAEQWARGQEFVLAFGSTLAQTFEAALFSGQSFFETFGQYLLNLVQQLIAAAAAALVLSLILSAIGGGAAGGLSIGALFKQNFNAMSGIPALASGGITTGPTLAMIGDNPGGKEVVMPLSRLNTMLSGNGGGSFRISGEDLVAATQRTDRRTARFT